MKRGEIDVLVIVVVVLAVLTAGLGGLSIWLYTQYSDATNNLDAKVTAATADAKKEQATADEEKFAQREKEPNRTFVGPDDYGRLTFDYPKTWSMYEAKNAVNGGDYEAYLNPGKVPPINQKQIFSLRVTILDREYSDTLRSYDGQVKSGKLKSSSFSANGESGTRLDGEFNNKLVGSAVFLKVRDKTVVLRTDAATFRPDFNNIIKTIKFNQ
jgi:hypothetical protein